MNEQQTQALIASITAQVTAQVLAALDVTTETPASTTTAPAVKADARYRTAKQIDSGHEQERVIYARYRATTGKGFKAMTAKQQAACRAEVRAVWAGLKGTRKTAV